MLQKELAEAVTTLVHGSEELEKVLKASAILFGKSTEEDLKTLDAQTFLDVFEGVPQASVSAASIAEGLDMIAALAAETNFLASNGEARRAIKENAISVNQSKVDQEYTIGEKDLIANQYALLQRGKKNYFILKIAS